jgi:hypothetical protein
MINKKCNTCKITETKVTWHNDRWNRIGWVCHNCFSTITRREERGFRGTKIIRQRPKGLKYNVRKKNKNSNKLFDKVI